MKDGMLPLMALLGRLRILTGHGKFDGAHLKSIKGHQTGTSNWDIKLGHQTGTVA